MQYFHFAFMLFGLFEHYKNCLHKKIECCGKAKQHPIDIKTKDYKSNSLRMAFSSWYSLFLSVCSIH